MPNLLVTGSRDYTNTATVVRVLRALARPELVLVHGAAKGLDTLARDAWLDLGLPALGMPADWTRYGNSAGPIRNQEMVNLGEHVLCVAFPLAKSRGTWDCVNRAKAAGIPTLVVQP